MDTGIVSVRYAKALMEYARSTDTTEVFYAEMRMLDENFRRFPELREALNNPVLPPAKKRTLVYTACLGNGKVHSELERFVSLVLKNGREELLHYMALAYVDLFRKDHHIGVAKLTTAVPVSAEMEERIRQGASHALHARMELHTEVNPEIEGGFIFDVNDYRVDASVATQFRRVKQQFVNMNKRIV